LNGTLADRPINEPTEMPGSEFPCGATASRLPGAISYHPTGTLFFAGECLQGEKKKGLPFRMDRDFPPALFKALDGFERNTQELRHLALCFSQLPSNR
jgi:hypothetical protein